MEYNKLIKLIGIILISILFLFSGITKIFTLNDTALNFHKIINNGIFSNIITFNAAQSLIVIAILILLISPLLMLIGISNDNKLLLKIGSFLLIGFTVLATLIYHPITDSTQHYNLLKNISIIGGLVIVLTI
jgi:uncharacterized membrane protein YphA (DoxX/SURF4 family)